MLEAAGFETVGTSRWIFMPAGVGQPKPPLSVGLRTSVGRRALRDTWIGDPQLAILARPVADPDAPRPQPRRILR
jgi:hypothetical protein